MNKNIIAMVVKHEYVFKLKEHKVEKCDLNLNNSLYTGNGNFPKKKSI